MTNTDFQNYGKETFDVAVKSFSAWTKGAQAIANEMVEASKVSMNEGTQAVEKLAGVKTFEKAFEVQNELVKTAVDSYMARVAKLNEIVVDTARNAYKPYEASFAKASGAK